MLDVTRPSRVPSRLRHPLLPSPVPKRDPQNSRYWYITAGVFRLGPPSTRDLRPTAGETQ